MWQRRSDALPNGLDVREKRLHARKICLTASSNCHIDCRRGTELGQQPQSYELTKTTLEAIPIDGVLLMPRNHDTDPRKSERGSEDSHIEMRSPNSLPLANYGLDVITPRQSIPTRKSKAVVRRLRTCSGV